MTPSSSSSLPPFKRKPSHAPPSPSPNNAPRLNPLQIAALLKSFWAELLANRLKPVRRLLLENHPKKLDFDSPFVRYAPSADASPLHVCAQLGLLPMARMLVNEFRLSATHRNKVGSTPLHVACKFGQRAMVSWLVDELHVPLDVPDAQHHTAFDVASYDVLDECILRPLRTQYNELKSHEQELMEENRAAREELERTQLVFGQRAMTLNDTESRLEEEKERIAVVQSIERDWHAQWRALQDQLDEQVVAFERKKEELDDEKSRAQEIYEKQVREVQENYQQAIQDVKEWKEAVTTTQNELERRQQLLVDQLGVFDAALREFAGSREVQLWVIATLKALPHEYDTDWEILLLRDDTIEVICHILRAFPTDFELLCEALELLLLVQTLSKSCSSDGNHCRLSKSLVDSDLLLLLGEVAHQLRGETQSEVSTTCRFAFEAMHHILRLPKDAQRIVTFCQRKHLHLLPLEILRRLQTTGATRCHAALVLLTFAQFGVKKVLLKNSVIEIVFSVLRDLGDLQGDTLAVEGTQYLFMALTLLTATKQLHLVNRTHQPPLLEELTQDCDAIRCETILRCVKNCSSTQMSVSMWGFKLLLNFVSHGGDTALRIRHGLLCEARVLMDEEPLTTITNTMKAVQLHGPEYTDECVNTILIGLELVDSVWVQRFDEEGRHLPVRHGLLTAIVDIGVAHNRLILLKWSIKEASITLTRLSSPLRVLASSANNRKNAAWLCSLRETIETDFLQPIFTFVLQAVDASHTSYEEPCLVELLTHILKLCFFMIQEELQGRKLAPDKVLIATRAIHNRSREIRLCAVLRAFKTTSRSSEPHSWVPLRVLCWDIIDLIRCTC